MREVRARVSYELDLPNTLPLVARLGRYQDSPRLARDSISFGSTAKKVKKIATFLKAQASVSKTFSDTSPFLLDTVFCCV